MEFLCDVHISKKLCKYLSKNYSSCTHINEILEKWNTTDTDICNYADNNNLIVITKDQDFKNSFILKNTPKKLIRIILGNISNEKLIQLFIQFEKQIRNLQSKDSFMVEIGNYFILYPDKD